jgi:arylsulfatase A-like enzyme
MLTAGCFVLSLMGHAQSSNAVESADTNVLLIVVDDLGWADLGCYGADLHETPHIDRFARQAIRFTDAYAAAPVCSPTRASIMTGKAPARLHMTVWYEQSQDPPTNRKLLPPTTVGNLPLEQFTLAELFRHSGYQTAHVGKWHLGDAAHYPEAHGFDINVGGTFWGAPSTFFFPYRGTWSRTTEFRYVPDLEWGRKDEYLTDRLTDEALTIMSRFSEQGPFFLQLAFHTVHTPIEAKPDDIKRFENRQAEGQHHTNPTYAAMVHSLDQNVGRVLSKLDALGIAQQTLVILTSDNGGYINEYRDRTVTSNHPLRSGKGSLYEGGIRVPLIVRWPGHTPANTQCDEPVLTTDFYPTLQECLSLRGDEAHNRDLDGLSLAGLLKDPTGALNRDALYFHYPHYYPTTTPVSAVRSGDWKLLEFFEDDRAELYNLADDLGESNNLAEQRPKHVAKLRHQLHDWRKAVQAQVPGPHPMPAAQP